mgnify:CR=1 FL=1
MKKWRVGIIGNGGICKGAHLSTYLNDERLEVAAVCDIIEERAVELGEYIVENKTTVRATAKKFGISKSTVHKDLSERLPHYNRSLYLQVRKLLDENKAERHIRGGMATKRKFQNK